MDNDAFAELGQARDQPWDRTLHAKLLNKLADDHCPLVVMDVFFQRTNNAQIDQMLAAAMARMPNIVLDADQASLSHPGLASVRPTLPLGMFLAAARMNWGVGWLNPDPDLIVRRHWPLFSPGPYPSLPWMAAKISGARLDNTPTERWVRYYDLDKTWVNLSYHFALAEGPGYFRDKIVFIGTQPRTSLPDNERDEFCTPQFHWTDETVGGVKVLATEYLNLMNHDWLSRMAWPVEMLLLTLTGTLLGAGLTHFRRLMTIILALGGALAITVTAVLLSQFTNYWFPWLIVVGGQLPCALAWVMIPQKAQAPPVAAPVEPVEPGEETSGRKRAR